MAGRPTEEEAARAQKIALVGYGDERHVPRDLSPTERSEAGVRMVSVMRGAVPDPDNKTLARSVVVNGRSTVLSDGVEVFIGRGRIERID